MVMNFATNKGKSMKNGSDALIVVKALGLMSLSVNLKEDCRA
jgi:hypothetical protein